ncbi:MAG: bifunctional adenosylcobinamide kinase/adenosylcobinamide-phosphate guanylyltransferase [Thermoanaerobacteraceae bacterium]|nr:bifunctional adenosylcobinamide kinase/adenosylcobinamide-phosphate guanylyltransferase [Thermoanaerobacteraceae bacterium]
MAEIILLTGGARSGKSRKAEELATGYKKVVYIATSLPIDDEMRQRIQRHRQSRPEGWTTVEKYRDLYNVILKHKDSDVILLDCITVMISNILMDMDIDWDNPCQADFERAEKVVMHEIDDMLRGLEGFEGRFIMVTNEVGMSLIPEYPLGRAFRDIAGFVNQRLAQISDRVYLMVSGIALEIKG